ncbi:MAG: Rieske (2Fe-2S) protein, partial [Flammeovirgaceae bacterium]|nr:Rieske (2Fe-2S) protein [Flammeovirgaceae bacterium]
LNKQTALKNTGGWLLIPQAQTLVVNDGSIKALTSVCTHTGCDRNWTYSNNALTCTCHGSRFSTTGAVLQGPATQPLRQFAVSVSNNMVTITK